MPEPKRTYSRAEVLKLIEIGGDDYPFGAMRMQFQANSMHLSTENRKPFEFNTYIRDMSRTKRSNRLWRRIYDILFLKSLEEVPLLLGSKKKYIKILAKFRLSINK